MTQEMVVSITPPHPNLLQWVMPIADPDERRKYQREWAQRRRRAFFAGKSCFQCGATEELELDHIDPATKVDHKIWSWSAERQATELEKCQVLCRACHQLKSASEAPIKHGWTMYKKYGCRCEECVRIYREYRRQHYHRNRQRRNACSSNRQDATF